MYRNAGPRRASRRHVQQGDEVDVLAPELEAAHVMNVSPPRETEPVALVVDAEVERPRSVVLVVAHAERPEDGGEHDDAGEREPHRRWTLAIQS
jgi:hypothetical protein